MIKIDCQKRNEIPIYNRFQKPFISKVTRFFKFSLTRTVTWSAKTASFTSMGKLFNTINIGIDVAKDELIIFLNR